MSPPVAGTRPAIRARVTLVLLLGVFGTLVAAGCAVPEKAVVIEEDPGLPNHTIYRPADLASVEGSLPIVLWGEGGCIAPGATYQNFLGEIAARGYLVIAGLSRFSPGVDSPELMLQGLDWAAAENARPGGVYFGRLDTAHVAAMGQSCGGLIALHAGTDPRISTVVAWNSGIFEFGSLGGATKDDLRRLNGPTMWVNSGPLDIAYPQAADDFESVPDDLPVVWANLDLSDRGGGVLGAHLATFFEPRGGAFTPVALRWLDFTLRGDEEARDYFIGPCGLCDEPGWSVQSKNWAGS